MVGVDGWDPEAIEGTEGNEESWRSLEIRFGGGFRGEASTRPALFKARIRSAILPPGLRIGPSELSESASLLHTRVNRK